MRRQRARAAGDAGVTLMRGFTATVRSRIVPAGCGRAACPERQRHPRLRFGLVWARGRIRERCTCEEFHGRKQRGHGTRLTLRALSRRARDLSHSDDSLAYASGSFPKGAGSLAFGRLPRLRFGLFAEGRGISRIRTTPSLTLRALSRRVRDLSHSDDSLAYASGSFPKGADVMHMRGIPWPHPGFAKRRLRRGKQRGHGTRGTAPLRSRLVNAGWRQPALWSAYVRKELVGNSPPYGRQMEDLRATNP